MDKVLYQVDGRIARITLNRPDVMNAIDDQVPGLLEDAVERANADPSVHVIILSGNGPAFCAGYDLTYYAQGNGAGEATQEMPWDPIKDYAFMSRNTDAFMSLWRSTKPVIAQVHGFAVAGGSDIALCCDFVVMADDAQIGYMPARVWGCPTTAMWVYRLGAEQAKRMLLTGDKISGAKAADMGLVLKAVPEGVHCYFENVGGKTMEGTLSNMHDHGRIALCGMIAWYSGQGMDTAAPGPFIWRQILVKRLRLQGFIIFDHPDRFRPFVKDVAPMIADGRIQYRESVTEGLENAPAAFMSMLEGGNFGKTLVKVG